MFVESYDGDTAPHTQPSTIQSNREWNGMEWNGMEWNGMEWWMFVSTIDCSDVPMLSRAATAAK